MASRQKKYQVSDVHSLVHGTKTDKLSDIKNFKSELSSESATSRPTCKAKKRKVIANEMSEMDEKIIYGLAFCGNSGRPTEYLSQVKKVGERITTAGLDMTKIKCSPSMRGDKKRKVCMAKMKQCRRSLNNFDTKCLQTEVTVDSLCPTIKKIDEMMPNENKPRVPITDLQVDAISKVTQSKAEMTSQKLTERVKKRHANVSFTPFKIPKLLRMANVFTVPMTSEGSELMEIDLQIAMTDINRSRTIERNDQKKRKENKPQIPTTVLQLDTVTKVTQSKAEMTSQRITKRVKKRHGNVSIPSFRIPKLPRMANVFTPPITSDGFELMEIDEQIVLSEINKFRSIPLSEEQFEEAIEPPVVTNSHPQTNLSCIVLDTNILVHDLYFVKMLTNKVLYGKNVIILVPYTVICELDGLKKNYKIGAASQLAIRWINDKLSIADSRVIGQSYQDYRDSIQLNGSSDSDDRIRDCCLQYQSKFDSFTLLLTNDINLRNKAILSSVPTFSVSGLNIELSKHKVEKDSKQPLGESSGDAFSNCGLQRLPNVQILNNKELQFQDDKLEVSKTQNKKHNRKKKKLVSFNSNISQGEQNSKSGFSTDQPGLSEMEIGSAFIRSMSPKDNLKCCDKDKQEYFENKSRVEGSKPDEVVFENQRLNQIEKCPISSHGFNFFESASQTSQQPINSQPPILKGSSNLVSKSQGPQVVSKYYHNNFLIGSTPKVNKRIFPVNTPGKPVSSFHADYEQSTPGHSRTFMHVPVSRQHSDMSLPNKVQHGSTNDLEAITGSDSKAGTNILAKPPSLGVQVVSKYFHKNHLIGSTPKETNKCLLVKTSVKSLGIYSGAGVLEKPTELDMSLPLRNEVHCLMERTLRKMGEHISQLYNNNAKMEALENGAKQQLKQFIFMFGQAVHRFRYIPLQAEAENLLTALQLFWQLAHEPLLQLLLTVEQLIAFRLTEHGCQFFEQVINHLEELYQELDQVFSANH